MKPEDWEELVAQVESHGSEKIVFETDDGHEVWVNNILFQDDVIKVLLS